MPAEPVQHTPFIFWVLFHIAVLIVLAFDLLVFHREAKPVTLREAATWTAIWVSLSLCFNALVWHWKGAEKGVEFLTGYVIEYSLSVDNIFVFVLVFTYFRVPPQYQHRVLFWGVLGALLMRGTMIAFGVVLVNAFHWVLYLFGAFLVFTGMKMLFHKGVEVHPEANPLLGFCRRFFPICARYEGARFVVKTEGKWMLTPLALVLVVVESTDLVFAVDSIPAIFAITTDPFIVYTSNVCAVLGLRSLYFLLANMVNRFVYLQTGLGFVLTFIGAKMLIADFWKMPTWMSLGAVVLILTVSIVASLLVSRKSAPPPKAVQPAAPTSDRSSAPPR